MGFSKPSMYSTWPCCTAEIVKVILASLACTVHGLGTQVTERSSMSHMVDVIGMMAYLEHIPMAVMIGGGMVIKDRVITRTNYEGCFV